MNPVIVLLEILFVTAIIIAFGVIVGALGALFEGTITKEELPWRQWARRRMDRRVERELLQMGIRLR